jgi:hypothetical protein
MRFFLSVTLIVIVMMHLVSFTQQVPRVTRKSVARFSANDESKCKTGSRLSRVRNIKIGGRLIRRQFICTKNKVNRQIEETDEYGETGNQSNFKFNFFVLFMQGRLIDAFFD